MTQFQSLTYPLNGRNFTIMDFEPFLHWAVENGTNDITIQNDEPIMCEIESKKHHVTNRLSIADVSNILTHLHSPGIMSTLNGGEEEDWAWNLKKNRNTSYRFRINAKSIQGQSGYSITLRIIKEKAPSIESLNFPPDMLDALQAKSGLIIFSGPTGSGKSTALASVIAWRLAMPESHIKVSTYENPIEYTYYHVNKPTSSISQMEIGHDIKSFAMGVRNALRTRSDVVLVGEARDYDTINACLNAAMNGPLVYTTTHTKNVAETLARLNNVFPENEKKAKMGDLIDNLTMIVTQKLILAKNGGRIAIREYLIFNQEIRDILMESDLDKITYTMRRVVKQYGKTFLEDLTESWNAGLIEDEVFEREKKDLK